MASDWLRVVLPERVVSESAAACLSFTEAEDPKNVEAPNKRKTHTMHEPRTHVTTLDDDNDDVMGERQRDD